MNHFLNWILTLDVIGPIVLGYILFYFGYWYRGRVPKPTDFQMCVLGELINFPISTKKSRSYDYATLATLEYLVFEGLADKIKATEDSKEYYVITDAGRLWFANHGTGKK